MSSPLQLSPSLSVGQTNFPALAIRLGTFFASRSIAAYLVGGVVRDTLLGRATGDLDIALKGDARLVGAEVARHLGGRPVVLDDPRGIVRVALPEGQGPSFVDLSSFGDDIRADLGRRDFTVDALAVSAAPVVSEGRAEIIDPYDGAADLRAGVIRELSPRVFEEDPGRLLRAPRLAAELGFTIASGTADSIRRHAHLVDDVAPERTRGELMRLLAQPSADASLRMLDGLGLLCRVIPELGQARGVSQPPEHHWDVFDHSIEAAGLADHFLDTKLYLPDFVSDNMILFPSIEDHFAREAADGHTRLTFLRLAGLLHDIAKPETKTVESSGRIRFLGHHEVGAEVVERIMRRLRFSRRGTDLVSRMVKHHLRPRQMAHGEKMPTPRAVRRYYRDLDDAAIDTLYLNTADYLAARGPDLTRDEWAYHARVLGHILREGVAPKSPKPPASLLNGDDIIEAFSLEPGPLIGSLLGLVREAQDDGEVGSRDEAEQLVRSRLESGGTGA